jgi:hypothetical protein
VYFTIPKSCIALTNSVVDFAINKGTVRLTIHMKGILDLLSKATRGKQLSNHINGLSLVINPRIVESYYVIVPQRL